MRNVRLAIFDLDGTLLDSLEDLANSANEMLQECGYPVHEIRSYRHFVGDGARTLVERILPDGSRSAEVIDQCLARYLAIYGRRWEEKSCPYDGIPGLLDGLRAREIALAVLSNKPQEGTERCMERFFGAWEWVQVIGHRVGHPKKPDPAGVREILRHAGVSAAETVYFGDTDTDMKTAVAAGVRPAGVLWGFRDREELERHGAEWVLGAPSDFFAILDEA